MCKRKKSQLLIEFPVILLIYSGHICCTTSENRLSWTNFKLSTHILCDMWQICHFTWCTALWFTNIACCIKGNALHSVLDWVVFFLSTFTLFDIINIRQVWNSYVNQQRRWCWLMCDLCLWFPQVLARLSDVCTVAHLCVALQQIQLDLITSSERHKSAVSFPQGRA